MSTGESKDSRLCQHHNELQKIEKKTNVEIDHARGC